MNGIVIDILRRIGMIVIFVLIQALVLNRIHLFDCASPLLYVYFVLMFPTTTPHWERLPLSFLLGLAIDIFSNTPGVASSSLTLLAFIQPYYLRLYVEKDALHDFTPSISSMGMMKFSSYALPLIFIYCLVYFSIEAFSFHHWLQWLMSIGGTWALTSIFILTINSTRR